MLKENEMNILVCDDDVDIVEAISIFLSQEGYNIFKAYDGLQVLEILERQKVHLVILDIMMPKLDGLQSTLKIRNDYNIPIILVSAKSEDTDKIIGLNFGADDYLTKPFNPLELIARVKSQLRRYTMLGSLEKKKHLCVTGGLVLNLDTKETSIDGENIALTPTELKILTLLMQHMGKVYSIQEIYEYVWEEEAYGAENTVAVHIRRMREKIEIDPKNPKYLKVVWGIGYKIEKYNE